MRWMREFARVYPGRIGIPFECAIEPRALNDEKVELLKAEPCSCRK